MRAWAGLVVTVGQPHLFRGKDMTNPQGHTEKKNWKLSKEVAKLHQPPESEQDES